MLRHQDAVLGPVAAPATVWRALDALGAELRGYGEAAVDNDLHDLGVKTVAIPRKGKPGAARQAREREPGFRKLIKWRTGSEGRISHLKHRYGWARSAAAGRERTATWCGHGVLAHNLVKITALAARPNPAPHTDPSPAPTRPHHGQGRHHFFRSK